MCVCVFFQAMHWANQREFTSYLIIVHNCGQWLHTVTIYPYVKFN